MKKTILLLVIVFSMTQMFAQNKKGIGNQQKNKGNIEKLQEVGERPEKDDPRTPRVQPEGVLVLVAHPNLKESTANKALMEVAQKVEKVTVKDLYADKKFDVDEYTQLAERAAAIVFQFPFYYASAPSQLKLWIDDVLYMFNKNTLKNKPLLIVTTTGSEEASYHSGARNQFTMDELLRPYQFTALHCGMLWQAPLVVYGMSTKDAEKNLSEGCKKYQKLLEELAKTKVKHGGPDHKKDFDTKREGMKEGGFKMKGPGDDVERKSIQKASNK